MVDVCNSLTSLLILESSPPRSKLGLLRKQNQSFVSIITIIIMRRESKKPGVRCPREAREKASLTLTRLSSS